MWRSFFLAIGITVILVGIQTLGVEKFILNKHEKQAATTADAEAEAGPGPRQEIKVKDYTPFTLMGLGAVVVIYAFDLPKRMQG